MVMRMLSTATLIVALLMMPSGPASARSKQKILGMHVEGDSLSAKERIDLFKVVQSKLRLYPNMTLVQPPDADLLDVMLDLECIDIDTDCLMRVGKQYGADRVFYAQVDRDADYTLLVRVVDVVDGSVMRDGARPAADKSELPGLLAIEVEDVFGAPPPPKPTHGTMVVAAGVEGASVFVDGAFVGTGRVQLKQPPGTYTVRVTRDGYTDAIFKLKIKAGKTTERAVSLKPLPPPEPEPVVATEDPLASTDGEPEFYETWWFWTIVGAVTAGAVAGAVVGLSGEDPGPPSGPLTLSVDRGMAWRDVSLRGTR
jgi:hypothetical protein